MLLTVTNNILFCLIFAIFSIEFYIFSIKKFANSEIVYTFGQPKLVNQFFAQSNEYKTTPLF